MLKLTSTVFLLLVAMSTCLQERHIELRSAQHEILDTTWVTNPYCDQECKQKNGTVCGNIGKECCDSQGCTGTNTCKGQSVPLTCFSYQDSWTFGGTCLPDCQKQGGNECGNVDKDCCRGSACESHFFGAYYTCPKKSTILHLYCPASWLFVHSSTIWIHHHLYIYTYQIKQKALPANYQPQ